MNSMRLASQPIILIPEIVEHGVTGLLSPPYDEELFAKNIATLLTDHDLKNNMGITARQRALKFYDCNLIFEKYEGILSEQSITPHKIGTM
jgi:glycosyltransferase involved in cell wall biosynthesis